MTRDEMQRCLEYFGAIYKDFSAGRDPKQMLDAWHDLFADDDKSLVMAASKAYASSGRFAPVPADIKAMMVTLTQPPDDGLSAWGLVQKAARNGYYGAEKEWAMLPQICREIVSPSQIKAWSMMDEATFSSVAQSNFLKAYRAAVERKKMDAMLPAEIRERRDAALAAARAAELDGFQNSHRAEIGPAEKTEPGNSENRAKQMLEKLRRSKFGETGAEEFERRRNAVLSALRGGK